MSMHCTITRITPTHIGLITKKPSLTRQLLNPPEPLPQGFWDKLFKRPPVIPVPEVQCIDDANKFELNQSWHFLHYILTGEGEGGPSPNNFICNGGTEIGDDSGYGPPRLLTNKAIPPILKLLDGIDGVAIKRSYVPELIEENEIYYAPATSDEGVAQDIEETRILITQLKLFLDDTHQGGDSVLIEIW